MGGAFLARGPSENGRSNTAGRRRNYWLARRSARLTGNGQLRRKDVPPGENLCFYCPAKCCHYIAVTIDRPQTWEEFDTVRWFLLHERTAVFVDNGQWYLLIYLTCNKLQADGRCAIYPTRPKVCRDYETEICEFEENAVYDQFFELPEQIEEYAEALLGPRDGGPLRSLRPNPLQVLMTGHRCSMDR